MSRAAAMAAPSKTANQENFPVASVLLPAHLRGTVMAYYHCARHADDIADSPTLSPEEKIARLDAIDAALLDGADAGPDVGNALAYRQAVGADPQLLKHASELLQAFRRDAVTDHCRDWGDLMTYCRFSAAPVGRFLLDLHGEDRSTWPAGDALCAALQVLNHLQDCGKDWKALARVYIPRDWLFGAGLSNQVLGGGRTPPELRRVLDMTLDATDGLIELARPLPGQIKSRHLRMEVAVILRVADRLSELLRAGDPLATSIKLGPLDYLAAFAGGMISGFPRP
ncbi:MAG: squalene synthase HpnC [Actinomycetota bacterium]